jgi:vacuolar-type H+-ATPase subunit D/Vma8
MLKYQANQVELLQQQISVQNALISELNREQQRFHKQLQDLQSSSPGILNSIAAIQQCDLAMLETQRLIKAKRIEIATADEKLDHLLHTFRDEERRLNAWEKLVDRERHKDHSALMISELREADANYLLSQLGRNNQ